MIFKKRKQPEKKKETKLVHPLKKAFMDKSLANTQNIIAKIEEKRKELFEIGRVKEGKEEEVNEKISKIVDYMNRVNWDKIIDDTLFNSCFQDINGDFTKRVDEKTAKFLLQLTWDSVREDVNGMIDDILILVYPRE